MKPYALIALFCLTSFTFFSCKKEEVIENAKITGYVKHHETHIPSATVYIKVGATEYPGANASDYDRQTTASVENGHFTFDKLASGNYYVYSVGYDSTLSEIVRGGIPIKISDGSETKSIDIPVTE
ncbi:MAG: hypothetical protein ACJAUV_000226 [Flavobacteriales bacterium]